MVAINRIHVDPHDWPPETFDPPPKADPIPWWTPLAVGLVLAASGVCFGFGFAAGWDLWEAMWK